MKTKKGIMPARPLCFGARLSRGEECFQMCDHEFDCFQECTMLPPMPCELEKKLNGVLLRENRALWKIVNKAREAEAEMMNRLAYILERNDTHVDSIDPSNMALNVTLGDVRGLVLSTPGVTCGLVMARRKGLLHF